MNLKEYGLYTVLTTLGISETYKPYLEKQTTLLEQISQFLKGDFLENTNENPLIPHVNILLEKIEKELIENLPVNTPYAKKWYWPDWRNYAISISHDVDKLSESKSHIWKIRRRFSKMTVLKSLLGIANPYNNFNLFLKLERQYGIRSAFYLLTDEYDIKKISTEIQRLQEHHMDLGLHGGFGSHLNTDQLIHEKTKLEKILNQKIYGIRQHFLKFQFPTTWNVQNSAAFCYDTTVGFNDKIGFKLGIAFPFYPPDIDLNPLPLIELPLIIMDAAIWTWLKLTETAALETILNIRDSIKRHHGLLTLLWHQCTLKMRGGRIYKELLKLLAVPEAFIAPGIDISNWWAARSEFSIKFTPSEDGLTFQFTNPKSAHNLGIMIMTKSPMRLKAKSSNLNVLESNNNSFKLTFLKGSSGSLQLIKV
ncbi:MAG: polysaccharide deacetylase family protein [Candidatus Helarchaeota archaeon]